MVRVGACIALAAALATTAPTLAQRASFSEFEASCRIDGDLAADCRMTVQGFFAEANETTPDKVSCDTAALWHARDAMAPDFADKPYYEALPELVSQPGVRATGASPPEPACAEGSPDPISVKSWTVTPAPEHDDDAMRIDYVLTNNLDVDVLDFRSAASYWREGQEVLYHSVFNDVSPIFPAGGDINGSVISRGGGTPYLAENPSLLTVIACTTLIVQADQSVVEY
jgi:hypothetical protein